MAFGCSSKSMGLSGSDHLGKLGLAVDDHESAF
jgi:hypothetical protein